VTGRPPRITGLNPTERFKRQLLGLPIDLQRAAREALKDLQRDPVPNSRRMHSLSAYGRPLIYTIDVTTNKSHKISFHLEGTIAVLRRVSTHKAIDRDPR